MKLNLSSMIKRVKITPKHLCVWCNNVICFCLLNKLITVSCNHGVKFIPYECHFATIKKENNFDNTICKFMDYYNIPRLPLLTL